eukprot:tig00000571_g2199.t1
MTQRRGMMLLRYIDGEGGGAAPARWLNLSGSPASRCLLSAVVFSLEPRPQLQFVALEHVYGGARLGTQPASRQHSFAFLRRRASSRGPPATSRTTPASAAWVECYGYSFVMDDLWDNLGRGCRRVTGLGACIKRSVIAEFALQARPVPNPRPESPPRFSPPWLLPGRRFERSSHSSPSPLPPWLERGAQGAFMRARVAPFFGRSVDVVLRAVSQYARTRNRHYTT